MPAIDLLLSAFLLCSPPQDPLAGWIKELKTRRDDAGAKLIHKIADQKTRPAMQGLVSAYDEMKSIFMRREIVRALVKFDGVAKAEQPAVEKIAAVAASARESELREAAIKALSECANLGNHFLKAIVDSRVSDDLRLMALEAHVKRDKKSDAAWYRKIWNPKRERRDNNKTAGVEVAELEVIRELAFQGIEPHITESELVQTLRDEFNAKIRRSALVGLKNRNSSKTRAMALWLFKRVDIPGSERLVAAKILFELQGAKIASTFIQLAKKQAVTQEDLRRAMADMIVQMNDDKVNKKVAKMVGRGKPHEKVFALLATRHIKDAKFVKKVRRGLKDKSFEVRRTTAQVLAEKGDRASLPDLEKMLKKPRTPDDARVAIEVIGKLEKGDAAWVDRLVALCKHERRDTRNAALHQLGQMQDEKHLATLTAALAHDDWTTRLVAIRALGALRTTHSIRVLIAQLGRESGRMARAAADALWNLTGQPFEENASKWQAWWAREGKGFSVISKDDLRKAAEKREMRRLQQRTVTAARFFGIRIVSHRVIFIIDTSGSMVYLVHGRMVGKRGATRIDVAKEELTKSIKALAPSALFNVYSFSSGVGRWLKKGIASASDSSRESALTFVERLGAGGATNLYDTIKLAFEDPDVDTIYLLSDGEPTAGAQIDPHRIRDDVRFWNRHRRIKIHTIAVGGTLEILQWLAADSGGSHVKMR